MLFEEIVGNESAKKYLEKIILSKSVANTLLFTGPDGVGKSLFALVLAEKMMYPEGFEENAKKKIMSGNHPDLHIFRPEGKTEMHSIASMRKLIDEVFLPPFEAEAKVFILHDAERMLPSSANAILKTLEEPTLDSYIILLSSQSDDILPTILSRCMKINFSRLTDEEVSFVLKEKRGKTTQEAKYFSTLSLGSVGRAMHLSLCPYHEEKKKILLDILSMKGGLFYGDLQEKLKRLEEILEKEKIDDASISYGHKEAEVIFSQVMMWMRDLHLLKMKGDRRHLFFSDNLSLLLSVDLFSLIDLEEVQQAIEDTRLGFKRNMKFKTCLEQLFLKILPI